MAVLSFNDAAHLLRRSGFAAHYDQITSLVGLTREAAADRVLDVSGAPSPTAGLPNLDKNRDSWPKYQEMVWFWADRAATSPTPIVEKMTLFWHGLLPTSLDKVFHHQQLMDQNTLYRTKGLGPMIDLYQEMAIQPAMLRYLDNADNVASAPNENFARELMELFLTGIGHYTEADVRSAALAWSGHILDQSDEYYVFDASKHHNQPTTFMGVSKVWNGPDIITHLIQGPKQTVVSRYLAERMWSFFAYPNPSGGIVDAIAGAMRNGGMRADTTLRAIFTHPEFYSATAKRGLVRSPFEFAVAAMSHTGQKADLVHPEWYGRDMGQAVFYPPNVSGWRPNQYWISSAAAWSKYQLASNLRWKLDKTTLLRDVASIDDTRVVAEQALAQFGIYQPSPRTLASLDQFVRAERSARGWGERVGLLFLPLLTPDFQMA